MINITTQKTIQIWKKIKVNLLMQKLHQTQNKHKIVLLVKIMKNLVLTKNVKPIMILQILLHLMKVKLIQILVNIQRVLVIPLVPHLVPRLVPHLVPHLVPRLVTILLQIQKKQTPITITIMQIKMICTFVTKIHTLIILYIFFLVLLH